MGKGTDSIRTLEKGKNRLHNDARLRGVFGERG